MKAVGLAVKGFLETRFCIIRYCTKPGDKTEHIPEMAQINIVCDADTYCETRTLGARCPVPCRSESFGPVSKFFVPSDFTWQIGVKYTPKRCFRGSSMLILKTDVTIVIIKNKK